MNTSAFFQLFTILAFSYSLASYPWWKRCKNLDNMAIKRELLDSLRYGGWDLEMVQHIFSRAHESFNDDFDLLHVLNDCNVPETFDYVLSKSVNMNPVRRAEELRSVLAHKLIKYTCTEGTPSFEMACTCLEEIKWDPLTWENAHLQFYFKELVNNGNIPLVEKFNEIGFFVCDIFEDSVPVIKKNRVKAMKYLVKYQHDLAPLAPQFEDLLGVEELTVADFAFFLENGLPLNYESDSHNWMEVDPEFASFADVEIIYLQDPTPCDKRNWLELALEKGRLDIAELVFNKGLRLDAQDLSKYDHLKEHIDKFAHIMATKRAFIKAKHMLIGRTDGNSALQYMPIETIYEMANRFVLVEKVAFLEDHLFKH